MLQCWEQQPEERPGFKEIHDKIFSIWNNVNLGLEVATETSHNRQVNANDGSQNYNNQELREFRNHGSNYNNQDAQSSITINYNNLARSNNVSNYNNEEV